MPLNKLENFIKNTEGRILYVNPSDLDATDAIENQGNSLTKPFKTIQRALIEAARFSYLRGNDNDEIEKTTILLYPGEHIVDNRPGYAIRDDSGTATAVAPSGSTSTALTELALDSDSNFDLTQEGNQLYKFNSINGGTIGLEDRKKHWAHALDVLGGDMEKEPEEETFDVQTVQQVLDLVEKHNVQS